MSGDDPHAGADHGVRGVDPPLIGPATAPDLHIMTWNIRRRVRYSTPRSADRWSHRALPLRALLRSERPTVLGVQEALSDQASYVRECLGSTYQSVGYGRGVRGRGEACPIFYDSARLELLNWYQHALSDTPSRPASRSWGNIFPRILVAAQFRDRRDSTTFLVLNTHLDHLSRRSRIRSVRAIRDEVVTHQVPSLVLGDFNAGRGSATLRALLAGEMLTDTWASAQRRESEEWGSFPNYRAPRGDRPRIDWILASPSVRTVHAAVNAQRYHGGWPSDHLPVQAMVRLPAESPKT